MVAEVTPLKLTKWAIIIIGSIVSLGMVTSAILYALTGLDVTESRPWSVIQLLLEDPQDSDLRVKAIMALSVPIIFVLLIVASGPIKSRKPIYGNARWATETEIKKAKLRSQRGILLGKHGRSYLCSDTATHTLLCGPTRAGKGTGVVIPNCLNWEGSLVVLDVKGENHSITSGFRKKHGHQVFYWAPMAKDGKSHRFNPLDQVSRDPFHMVTDVQLIASLLVDVSDKDPMWGLEGRALFVAATLFVLQNRPTKTLGEVYRTIASESDLQDLCERLLKTIPSLSPEVRRGLGSFASKSPKEASSVRSTLASSLRLFENPVIDAATSASDFNIADLRRQRMSIYVGALASQLDAIAPLLRLFFQQIISTMSSSEPADDEPHKVLMLLDEFASLGPMDAVVSAFTLLAGYNVRILAVIQGITWLDRVYGRDTREGLISCCGNQIFMTTNDETTSKYVSETLGDQTIDAQSITRRPFSFEKYNPSRNSSKIGRPLLSKQEVRTLDRKKQVVIVEGHNPILARKIQYFKDRAFTPRLLPAAKIQPLDLTAAQVAQSTTSTPGASGGGASLDNDAPLITPIEQDEPLISPGTPPPEATALKSAETAFLAILAAEMDANPAFAEAHREDVRRLSQIDSTDLDRD